MSWPAKEYSVLVVDDDSMVARIHTQFLATLSGFRVVATVHTGAEALAALTEFHPDLMLLDVYLGPAVTLPGRSVLPTWSPMSIPRC